MSTSTTSATIAILLFAFDVVFIVGTIPSFRIALAMEKEEWKPFRNALDKSDTKKFDEMWDIPRCYISACSNSVQYVRLHPILMSILLYDFKQLTQCISEVESIEAKVNSKKKEWLTKKKKLKKTLRLEKPYVKI
jgi:hypothetical protein